MSRSWARTRPLVVLACLFAASAHAEAELHLARVILAQGPIKELKLPEGWRCSPDPALPAGTGTLCRRGRNPMGLALSIVSRAMPVGTAYDVFHRIPNSISIDTLVPGLLSDEIRALSPALGPRGDNQYMNSLSYPNPQAPAFHLSNMQYIAVSGRIMIEADGQRMDPQGKSLSFDQSVVSESPYVQQNIDDIALEAPEPADQNAARALFRAIIQTIQWRE